MKTIPNWLNILFRFKGGDYVEKIDNFGGEVNFQTCRAMSLTTCDATSVKAPYEVTGTVLDSLRYRIPCFMGEGVK